MPRPFATVVGGAAPYRRKGATRSSALVDVIPAVAPAWQIERGPAPLAATAIHAGHTVRPEVEQRLALDAAERRYEEDPFTDRWIDLGGTSVAVGRSRFEVDLNRPRDRAVYLRPEDAWGLDVWSEPPPAPVIERSRALHDAFYRELDAYLGELATDGEFVVYDVHSYNHRRGHRIADPAGNPDVNVGTGSLDRARWAPVVDRFIDVLSGVEVHGRPLDVRENVRFEGGYLPSRVHDIFGDRGCAIAIDVKKIYVDEHRGELVGDVWRTIGAGIAATVDPVTRALQRRS